MEKKRIGNYMYVCMYSRVHVISIRNSLYIIANNYNKLLPPPVVIGFWKKFHATTSPWCSFGSWELCILEQGLERNRGDGRQDTHI